MTSNLFHGFRPMVWAFLPLLGIGMSSSLLAQNLSRNDRVEIRDDSRPSGSRLRYGTVLREDARVVELQTEDGKVNLDTAEVIEIFYDVNDQDWVNAVSAERNRQWANALGFYEAFQVRGGRGNPWVVRQAEFKVAQMKYMLAEIEPQKFLLPAQDQLRLFIKNHADSRQVLAAGEWLGRALLAAQQPTAEACDLIAKLRTPEPSNWNHRCTLLIAHLKLREGVQFQATKPESAAKLFEEVVTLCASLQADLNATRRLDAALYSAQALAGLGQIKEAEQKIVGLFKNVGENVQQRALLHLTLGDCYMLQKRYEDAARQYLFVDVLYNQDREPQARAVVSLIQVFETRQDSFHAKMYRERLNSDPALKNTSHARTVSKPGSSQ